MKSRPRNGRKTSSRHRKRSSPLLPFDLMMDIFSRLSLKTIAICRCVSKHWAFVLVHSDFRNLLLKRSQGRPQSLLLAYMEDKKVFFLSSPHPDDDISSDHHHYISFSFDHTVKNISTTVGGLVCVRIRGNRFEKGRKCMVEESVICNPSTGQSLSLPRMNTKTRTGTVSLFGYDPVEKVHKVLGITRKEHQVLTLGGGKWRMTERGGVPFSPSGDRHNICINGVVYYTDFVDEALDKIIICFDVRSEKYSFVKLPKEIWFPGLLDCNGKLGLVKRGSVSGRSKRIEMWVLQDSERHEWSKCCYTCPPMWKDVVGRYEILEIVGGTGPNEFVMSPTYSSDPFHVYYCNFDKDSVTRVVSQVGAFGSGRRPYVHTFLNHVEDVKLMEL